MSASSTQNTQSTNSSAPTSAIQASDLNNIFAGTQTALNQASQAVAPTNFTAQFTPDELNAFQQMITSGSNLGVSNGQANTGAALSTAGTNGVTGALSGLNNFNAGATNNAATVGANAQSLVNAQNIPAQVAQAEQAATQQANEVTLPGIEQNAAAGGNTNSSRTGIADGLVQQGLAENTENLTGALTGQAEANAENLAQTQANNNNTANLGALSSAGSIGNTAANTGVNAGTAATNDQINLAGEAAAGGAGQTAAEQANLTNQEQQFQSATSSPFVALQNALGIAGTNAFGQTTTGNSTTTSTPSIFSTISGLLSGGGALLNGLGSSPSGGTSVGGATLSPSSGGSGLLGAIAKLA